jgi:hypothetical protein
MVVRYFLSAFLLDHTLFLKFVGSLSSFSLVGRLLNNLFFAPRENENQIPLN